MLPTSLHVNNSSSPTHIYNIQIASFIQNTDQLPSLPGNSNRKKKQLIIVMKNMTKGYFIGS